MPPRPPGRMLVLDRPPTGTCRAWGDPGCAIIEEWTAWFLVRERERELSRGLRIKEAERPRTSREGKVMTLRVPGKTAQTPTPPPQKDRKAA